MPLVRKINALELEYQKLSEEELKQKTQEFKARLANGETTSDIMCEAFATVKNACRRLVGSEVDRKSKRLNSSHSQQYRMPSSA